VIDGINRDVSLCLELGYPIYSRDHWMRTGKDRVQVEATGIPVNIGDVRVCPGDLMRGDADGVVVIPQDRENEVLDAAEAIQAAEDAIRQSVREGMSLRQAREKHRYHQLFLSATPTGEPL
jgi:regulator of RNase E activity RraA